MKLEVKQCQKCKNDFTIEPEDFNFYEKIKVPPPTFCPECRMVRRMTWRNERTLFHRVCDFSGKKIVTMFHPDSKVKVYDRDIWWGDKWEPTDYGMDYDFARPFFEQYKELLSKVPLQNLGNENCINSPYINHSQELKNCYFVYASHIAEDTSYSLGASRLKNCFDTYKLQKSEQCYGAILSDSLYAVHFSYDCDNSLNSFFLRTCVNCQDCIGCINLRNKKYCILNEQYTKEEYSELKKELDFGSYKVLSDFEQKYQNFILKFPRGYASIIKSINCSGDNIMNSKNLKDSFDSYGEVEDSRYLIHGLSMKDSYDCYGYGGIASLLYEGVDAGLKAYNQYFSVFAHSCIDTDYTYMCYDSKNLFGCIGIRKGQYCILNKKYTKEEYETLIPKIKQHMLDMPYTDSKGIVYKYGEFFPSELSPFAYNETIAQEYFSLKIDEIKKKGYFYREPLKRDYKITIKSENLPDHIKDAEDNIISEIIACPNNGNELTQCTQAYQITEDELTFLRRYNIALPRYCPNCRHYMRLKQRNPMKLWHRTCMCKNETHSHAGGGDCMNEFETSYAPERPEIIYCEKCYQQEVI
jgi:hypothetical protein